MYSLHILFLRVGFDMSWNTTAASDTTKAQEKDVAFPNVPSDSISCLATNGDINTPSNLVVAGSWDNSVSDQLLCLFLSNNVT